MGRMVRVIYGIQFTLLLSIATAAHGLALAGDLPDHRMTPGAINPNVTQANISRTVCAKGYSKTIRPPAHLTNRLKKQQIREYGYADRNPKHYEEDHLIPLSIGGAPEDRRNLWPEPRQSEWGADKKDQFEFVLYKMVCAHEIALADAQREIATDWIAAWKKYVPSHQNHRFSRARADRYHGQAFRVQRRSHEGGDHLCLPEPTKEWIVPTAGTVGDLLLSTVRSA